MNKLILEILCAVVLLSASVLAQRPPAIVSPEVQSDGRVTFRFADPNALKVELELEGEKTPHPMQKDDHGIWSLTVGHCSRIFTDMHLLRTGWRLLIHQIR